MKAKTPATLQASTGTLPNEIKRLIADNLFAQVKPETLRESLIACGMDARSASKCVDDAVDHPYVKAGAFLAQRLIKLESLLDVLHVLETNSGRLRTVARDTKPSAEDFFARYYFANRPVVLEGCMNDWPALSGWTHKYLVSKFGDEIVEVMGDREGDPDYEVNAEQHRRSMRFADFLSAISGRRVSNDLYMVSLNENLKRKRLAGMKAEIIAFPEYLDRKRSEREMAVWIGPAGAVTPLHHDLVNVILAQVRGRKRVSLIPSWQLHRVYNNRNVFSDIDLDHPAPERHPRFKKVKPLTVTLRPGQALFIPVGWWHHVRSLSFSISVTFTHFRKANRYPWKNAFIRPE